MQDCQALHTWGADTTKKAQPGELAYGNDEYMYVGYGCYGSYVTYIWLCRCEWSIDPFTSTGFLTGVVRAGLGIVGYDS